MEYKISDFIKMQQQLREAHGWEEHTPEKGSKSLLWAIGEMGEIISIIKKKGDDAIMENSNVRAHFLEEISDVMMYMCDMFDCYDISGEELSEAYAAKFERNMSRTWEENKALYENKIGTELKDD